MRAFRHGLEYNNVDARSIATDVRDYRETLTVKRINRLINYGNGAYDYIIIRLYPVRYNFERLIPFGLNDTKFHRKLYALAIYCETHAGELPAKNLE